MELHLNENAANKNTFYWQAICFFYTLFFKKKVLLNYLKISCKKKNEQLICLLS